MWGSKQLRALLGSPYKNDSKFESVSRPPQFEHPMAVEKTDFRVRRQGFGVVQSFIYATLNVLL